MQRLWQPLFHVASLMNLAPLDRCGGAEGPTDDLAQRLGTVDDEQPADLRVEPAVDQVVDQRLHDGGIVVAFEPGESATWLMSNIELNGGDQPCRGSPRSGWSQVGHRILYIWPYTMNHITADGTNACSN